MEAKNKADEAAALAAKEEAERAEAAASAKKEEEEAQAAEEAARKAEEAARLAKEKGDAEEAARLEAEAAAARKVAEKERKEAEEAAEKLSKEKAEAEAAAKKVSVNYGARCLLRDAGDALWGTDAVVVEAEEEAQAAEEAKEKANQAADMAMRLTEQVGRPAHGIGHRGWLGAGHRSRAVVKGSCVAPPDAGRLQEAAYRGARHVDAALAGGALRKHAWLAHGCPVVRMPPLVGVRQVAQEWRPCRGSTDA